VANGVTDDAVKLNRAIQQIYVSSLNGTYANAQRTIKIPAGTYIVNSSILIPPNCTIVGDGKSNTIIKSTVATPFVFCDSLFQIGTNIGTNGASLPTSITIKDLTVYTTLTNAPAMIVNTATDVVFDRVKFRGGNYGLSITGVSDTIRINDCTFTGYATAATFVATAVTGLVTRTNYFDTTNVTLSTGTRTITTLATGAGVIKYQLADTANNYRIGELKYNKTGSVLSFDDEYTEPAGSLGANLFANASGTLTCTVTGTSYLKYNLTQFI